MTEEQQPWEVQPNETPRAFSAFIVYRDIGARRSLRKAARIFYEIPETEEMPFTSPKLRQFKTWSANFGWVGRGHAWDVHLDEETRYDNIVAVKEMRKRHATVANMAIAKSAERLRVLQSAELSIGDATRLFDLAVKVERLSRGEPDRIGQISGIDGAPISVSVDKISVDALEARLKALLTESVDDVSDDTD